MPDRDDLRASASGNERRSTVSTAVDEPLGEQRACRDGFQCVNQSSSGTRARPRRAARRGSRSSGHHVREHRVGPRRQLLAERGREARAAPDARVASRRRARGSSPAARRRRRSSASTTTSSTRAASARIFGTVAPSTGCVRVDLLGDEDEPAHHRKSRSPSSKCGRAGQRLAGERLAEQRERLRRRHEAGERRSARASHGRRRGDRAPRPSARAAARASPSRSPSTSARRPPTGRARRRPRSRRRSRQRVVARRVGEAPVQPGGVAQHAVAAGRCAASMRPRARRSARPARARRSGAPAATCSRAQTRSDGSAVQPSRADEDGADAAFGTSSSSRTPMLARRAPRSPPRASRRSRAPGTPGRSRGAPASRPRPPRRRSPCAGSSSRPSPTTLPSSSASSTDAGRTGLRS